MDTDPVVLDSEIVITPHSTKSLTITSEKYPGFAKSQTKLGLPQMTPGRSGSVQPNLFKDSVKSADKSPVLLMLKLF